MKSLKLLIFSVLIILIRAEEKVSYRNAKYVEFVVQNEKQLEEVKNFEFDSRVS